MGRERGNEEKEIRVEREERRKTKESKERSRMLDERRERLAEIERRRERGRGGRWSAGGTARPPGMTRN